MNISGKWSYKEDFEFGKSVGEVELSQIESNVTGTFTFTEEVEGDYKIEVKETVEGTIAGQKLLLESIAVDAFQNGKKISYLPNNFEIYLTSENELVGSTYDSEDVCGVFVMERI